VAILKAEGKKAVVKTAAGAIVVDGDEPADLAVLLCYLPGVNWTAVGRRSNTLNGIFENLASLAGVYLRRGDNFSVTAEVSGSSPTVSDLTGRAVSTILDRCKGSRVRERSPSVRFKVVSDGIGGVSGVVLADGPGGTPTGPRSVCCLVSGGMHSSVLAWYALQAGLRVVLLHAKVSDESLREVARLYAELSHRVEPSAIRLRVLEGYNVRSALEDWTGRHEIQVYAGSHSECRREGRTVVPSKARAPLYLLPEEEFRRLLASLSLKGCDAEESRASEAPARLRERTYGGGRAELHGVLDGLR